MASPSYFEAAGIALRAGRLFDRADRDGPPVVVVSEKVARRHFGDEEPVGRTLVVGTARTEGIYGLVSYSVGQRRRELGVRVAMGAGRRDIGRLVLGEGRRMALVGGALGLAGAFAVGRIAGSFLDRVDAWDPPTLVAVVLLFTAVALAATLLPAVRATRVDPARVLRED